MGAVLSDNTMVVHPETGVATFLAKGETVPAWAGDLVGEHLTATDAEPEPVAADEKPAGNASRDAWAAYAATQGAPEEETAEGGLSRDELRDKYGQ